MKTVKERIMTSRKKGEVQNNNLEDQRERPRRDAKAIGEIGRKEQMTLR